MEEKKEFREILRKKLTERGWTQKEFAKRAGLTQGQLSHYLSGYRFPESAVMLRIAKALDVSVTSLLPLTDEEKEHGYGRLEREIRDEKKNLTSEERMRLILLLSKED